MNKPIDELIKEKFADSKYNIPASYEKKLNETIKEIENLKIENSPKRVWWLNNKKVVGAAVLVLMLSVVSVSSYAAVNMFQQRMDSLSEKEMENYNSDVQKSNVETDTYSRELTDREEEKMIYFRTQYEKKGMFPQNEINQVKSKEDIMEGVLCFVAEESKFYLPERTLTEEEMLEIIDLQEKRDYSVQQQNKVKNKPDKKDSQMELALQKQSVTVVAALYNLHESALKFVSSDIEDGSYEFVVKGEDVHFSVYYSKENAVERIVYAKDNLPAHESGVKIEDLKTKSISEKMKKRVEVFTGKEIAEQSCYTLIDRNGKLAYGTVSYYYQMSDGSGCVAVYSTVYHDLYDIYTMDDETKMQEIIKVKRKKAEESGYTYRLIK